MPHRSPFTCTTTGSASLPKTQPPSPPPSVKRRGNPDLHLSPRCGARTRAGCPCRAPAIHGKLRCRMHGGRSTGPRTEEGRARLAAARTTHGGYDAAHRAFNRHHVSFLRRSPVRMFAVIHRDRLPPELAARMAPLAPELSFPPRPTRGISRAEDRALLQAETAALAPWKQAMALSREARRAERAARAASSATGAPAQATPLAPERAAIAATAASAARRPPQCRRLPLRQRRQKPMHLFPRLPPSPGRTLRGQAVVRRRWQNPVQQNPRRTACATSRRRPVWQRSQKPTHQFPLLLRSRCRNRRRPVPVWRRE